MSIIFRQSSIKTRFIATTFEEENGMEDIDDCFSYLEIVFFYMGRVLTTEIIYDMQWLLNLNRTRKVQCC